MIKNYELFVMAGCPFCTRVTSFMKQRGIDIPLRDITADPKLRQTLQDIGGKVQVPCLLIEGTPLYESADIIAYLDKVFS